MLYISFLETFMCTTQLLNTNFLLSSLSHSRSRSPRGHGKSQNYLTRGRSRSYRFVFFHSFEIFEIPYYSIEYNFLQVVFF